jgi:chromosome segregation ATPase
MGVSRNFTIFIFCICAALLCFWSGYYVRYRSAIRQAGQSDNEFRTQLENKQRRIDELEARLGELGDLVSDGFANVSGTVERISVQVDDAIKQTGDIRATVRVLRETAKELETSRDYFRRLSGRVDNIKYNNAEMK